MSASRVGSEEASAAFVRAACVPVDGWHGGGTLEEAQAILAAHPQVATGSIHVAAVLGDEVGVRRFLAADAGSANAKGGAHGWDPLTHLCFSRYLRLDRSRAEAFVRTAQALLDAGASPNTGFHAPNGEFESVVYGAAGVARDPALTRLLLERGADPNDGETAYHAPETLDDRVVHVLVASGKLRVEGVTKMLYRKLDWQHYDGVAWLLAHGADANRWALHHALGRASPLRYFELLMDHGADPTRPATDGRSAFVLAARRGRADVLELFRRRGFDQALAGDDAFLEACTRADDAAARRMLAAEPGLVARLQAEDGALLAEFAGGGNTAGVRLMLDLGFDIGSRTGRGGANADTALHVAVWRERVATVRLLIERGAPLEATNGGGETPLSLAVRALAVQSDWTPHASTEIVSALLDAGARVDSVQPFPSGSAEADALLRRYGRR